MKRLRNATTVPGRKCPKPHVRLATLNDLNTLVRFALALALETEGRRLNPRVARAGVRTLLDGTHGFILVAELTGRTVGMIMVGGREWSDWSNGLFWWTTGMYVTVESRRSGVLHALYAHLRTLAQENVPPVVGLRGYVAAANISAQKVQRRIGRRKTGYVIFEERFGAKSKVSRASSRSEAAE